MTTDFEQFMTGLMGKGVALVLIVLCAAGLPMNASAGQMLTQEKIHAYRSEYAALYNEMLDILESPRFYEAGFSKGYPKAHAWASKIDKITKQYDGQSLVTATYNALSDSALIPDDLWQIANEIRTHKKLTAAAKKLLGQVEYNILMGDSMDTVEEKLPGIDKYRNYMTYQGFYWSDGYEHPNLPGPVSIKWLQLNVPEDNARIPARYHANGQTLMVGVVSDGSALLLRKAPTKAVFLDKTVKHDGQDMIISLR